MYWSAGKSAFPICNLSLALRGANMQVVGSNILNHYFWSRQFDPNVSPGQMLDANTEPGGINFCLVEVAKKITWSHLKVFKVPVWPLAYMRRGSLSLTRGTNPVLAMSRTAVGSLWLLWATWGFLSAEKLSWCNAELVLSLFRTQVIQYKCLVISFGYGELAAT